MKRKAKKAAIGRKERHLTAAELKKISAGVEAAMQVGAFVRGGQRAQATVRRRDSSADFWCE